MSAMLSPISCHFDKIISEKSIATIKAAHERPALNGNLSMRHIEHSHLGAFSRIYPDIEDSNEGFDSRYPAIDDIKCKFNDFQLKLINVLSTYTDLLYTNENFDTLDSIQEVYVAHIVRHILSAQSRIIQNDKKLAKKKIGDDLLRDDQSLRDQGYTRAKVLCLLPFRFSALKLGKLIQKIVGSTHAIHHLDRFIQEFGDENGADSTLRPISYDGKKPDDYHQTFRGNTDDSFRIGVKFTKKSVKFFSEFYDSDIIIASPLGLKTILTPEDPNTDSAMCDDKDFLSSIEIVVLDQAEIFLMQNWEHIMDIMQYVNLMPAKPRKMNISRIRMWHLENWSRYYRQLIMFSSISVPLIHSFFQAHSFNYEGCLISKTSAFDPQVKLVETRCNQQFLYYESDSAKEASNARFSFFIKKVLPNYSKSQENEELGHTLIIVGSYFDYVRLRNYFRRERLSFTQICEYSEQDKIAKARQLFFFGARKFLLYTERCHYYNRFVLKGVRNVIFYEPPTFPKFYSEILNMLRPDMQGKKFGGSSSPFEATTLFTKHDTLQLGAIIGLKHAVELTKSKKSIT